MYFVKSFNAIVYHLRKSIECKLSLVTGISSISLSKIVLFVHKKCT